MDLNSEMGFEVLRMTSHLCSGSWMSASNYSKERYKDGELKCKKEQG